MIRIPVPSGVAGVIAVVGGALLILALIVVITAKERSPASPGAQLVARIVGGLTAAWGLLITLGWFSASLRFLTGKPGLAALLLAVAALAFVVGELALVGAGVAAAGGLLGLLRVLTWMGMHVYGALLWPPVCLLGLAVVIAVRRRR
jgi:hypothetical protein